MIAAISESTAKRISNCKWRFFSQNKIRCESNRQVRVRALYVPNPQNDVNFICQMVYYLYSFATDVIRTRIHRVLTSVLNYASTYVELCQEQTRLGTVRSCRRRNHATHRGRITNFTLFNGHVWFNSNTGLFSSVATSRNFINNVRANNNNSHIFSTEALFRPQNKQMNEMFFVAAYLNVRNSILNIDGMSIDHFTHLDMWSPRCHQSRKFDLNLCAQNHEIDCIDLSHPRQVRTCAPLK